MVAMFKRDIYKQLVGVRVCLYLYMCYAEMAIIPAVITLVVKWEAIGNVESKYHKNVDSALHEKRNAFI